MVHNSQEVETTHVSMDEWMHKQNMVYAYMEYYSALGREDILTRATTWMNLEDTNLSKIDWIQKNKTCIILFI